MLNAQRLKHTVTGVSKGNKGLQKALIIAYVDEMLRRNATNGMNGDAPLVYKEALEVAKTTVQV